MNWVSCTPSNQLLPWLDASRALSFEPDACESKGIEDVALRLECKSFSMCIIRTRHLKLLFYFLIVKKNDMLYRLLEISLWVVHNMWVENLSWSSNTPKLVSEWSIFSDWKCVPSLQISFKPQTNIYTAELE